MKYKDADRVRINLSPKMLPRDSMVKLGVGRPVCDAAGRFLEFPPGLCRGVNSIALLPPAGCSSAMSWPRRYCPRLLGVRDAPPAQR